MPIRGRVYLLARQLSPRLVASAAQGSDQDAVRVLDRLPPGGGALAGEQAGQREAEAGERPDAQELSPADALTITGGYSEVVEHGGSPWCDRPTHSWYDTNEGAGKLEKETRV